MTKDRCYELGYICFSMWLLLIGQEKKVCVLHAITDSDLGAYERECLIFVFRHCTEGTVSSLEDVDDFFLKVKDRGEEVVQWACFLCFHLLWSRGCISNNDILTCPVLCEITEYSEIAELLRMLSLKYESPQLSFVFA